MMTHETQMPLFSTPVQGPSDQSTSQSNIGNERGQGATLIKEARYAQVLLQLEHPGLASRIFTYAIPEEWQDVVQVGIAVKVPFGAMAEQIGYVVGLSDQYTHSQKAKAIGDVLDESPLFNQAYFEMLQWIAEYYATPLYQVFFCALPSQLIQKSRREIILEHRNTSSLALPVVDHKIYQYISQQWPKTYTTQQLAKQLNIQRKPLRLALKRLTNLGLISVKDAQQRAVREKTERMVLCQAAPSDSTLQALTKKQRAIYDELALLGEAAEKTVLQQCQTTRAMLQKLVDNGLISIEERPVFRDPLTYFQQVLEKLARQNQDFILSSPQQQAVDAVLDGDADKPYLLYGVTGSGKTEVYLHLTQRMLAQGKSVMLLVPEIALTSQLAKRFMAFFGPENIALWHSHLSAGEKSDTWRRLMGGDLKIVIAARSGVWAPLSDLGLIILDEEHDGSFKQDAPVPRYHAKTVAEFRARQAGAKLLLGSATPDLGTFYQAEAAEHVLRLPERFGGRPLAKVIVVDMKKERREGLKGNLSRLLKENIKENLAQQEQSILLINRRGFYTTLQCGHCDHKIMCVDCDVALTYHKPLRQVRCHYCGHQAPSPQFCPICASSAIHQSGVGTQRVEEELLKAFPEARVIRMDTDTLTTKNSHHDIYQRFASGEADILIGTQIVAKGLDIANVTLVGVIAADSTFSLPDFKATERGFQMLTQVAGRAGRGQKPGRVIFQSALSDLMDEHHPVIRYASAQDYPGFYAEELQERQSFHYPPFSQLFRMIFSAENEKAVMHFAQATAAHLRLQIADAGLSDQIHLIGPASCVIPRIQARYRFHLMIKNLAGEAGHRLIAQFYQNAPPPEGIYFHLDIDALSLL